MTDSANMQNALVIGRVLSGLEVVRELRNEKGAKRIAGCVRY